jgi:hypothetical protein
MIEPNQREKGPTISSVRANEENECVDLITYEVSVKVTVILKCGEQR